MTGSKRDRSASDPPLELRIGHHELVVRRRYEVVSIINDLLIGIWFVIGSILFFSPDTTRAGTWLFVIGSGQLLVRPLIRLSRHLHLVQIDSAGVPKDSSPDF